MEFIRKRKREWRNELGYRITRLSKVASVSITPRFYACVRCERPGPSGVFQWWNFSQHRRPYKTFQTAKAACEFNHRIWNAFIELSRASGSRTQRLATLKARGGYVLDVIPVWVLKAAEPSFIQRICCSTLNQIDPTEASQPIESAALAGEHGNSSTNTLTSTPASNAEGKVKSLTLTAAQPPTTDPITPPASSATGAVASIKTSSRQLTKRKSVGGGKSSKRGKRAKRSAKAA